MRVARLDRMQRLPTTFERAIRRVAEAEDDLRKDVAAQQERWRYRVHRGRVTFEHEARRAQQRFKQRLRTFVAEASFRNLLTTPLIYSLLLPLVLLDIWVTVYQRVCFPIYGIAKVRRRHYFALDRRRLAYLNIIEKANCTYCGYASGLIAYVREIAARTEQYWCPIKHADTIPDPHSRYHHFVEYGDAAGYRESLPSLRTALRGGSETHDTESRPPTSDTGASTAA